MYSTVSMICVRFPTLRPRAADLRLEPPCPGGTLPAMGACSHEGGLLVAEWAVIGVSIWTGWGGPALPLVASLASCCI